MLRKKHLTLAVSAAMGISTMAFMPSIASAQDETLLEEVVVTGSRIKRADLDSPSPVTVIDREALTLSGLTDVGDILQSMPSMSGSPIGTTTNNGGNGSVQVDLRGLGVNRTLTLINGRRTVDGGDYQTIPSIMVDRVEILKDGASAVYGADAVAGVVNIITRKGFDGVEFEAQTADFFDMDSGSQTGISMIAGKDFDRGHFVFGAEYVDQEAALQSDAPWDFFQDSYYIYPEGCESHPTRPYDGTPAGGCYPLGSSRIPEGRLKFAGGDSFMNEGNGLVPFDGRTYNYAPVNYIQTPYKKTNFFLEGKFEISENLEFFTEVRANLRNSSQQLAPMPYDSRFDPAYNGQFDVDGDGALDPYSGVSEDNFYLARATAAAGLAPEPLIDARRRMVETSRVFEQEVNQIQAVFGFRGTINEIDWEFSYNKGERTRTDRDFGQFSGARLAHALGPSADLDGDGSPECYGDISDPSTIIASCVPLNIVDGAGTITPDMIAYLSADLTDHQRTESDIFDLSFTGLAFDLPGGELGWAAGAQYYAQEFVNSVDSGKATDSVTGSTGAGTEGKLNNTSVYAEIYAPLWESDNGMAVNLTGGIRWDDYDAFGSDTTWQAGIEFQVTDDLMLRSTAGTVFRAPTIGDLFGGVVEDFPTYSDPCDITNGGALPAGCSQSFVQSDNQLRALVGGNPDLVPETGDTFTAGLVWTPTFAGNDFSLTLDYWKTQIEDGISSLGVQFILDECYINQSADACSLVTRRSDFSIDNVQDASLNVAEQTAAGVDTELRWDFDSAIGQWRASFLWTHLIERTKTASPGAKEDDLAGRYTDPTAEDGGAYPEDKFNYSVTWMKWGLALSYMGEYVGEMDADTFCNCGGNGAYIQEIDSFLYHDLVASYNFDDIGLTVSGGVTNLTDEEPPYIDVGFGATTDPTVYRMFGRGYYLRLNQKF